MAFFFEPIDLVARSAVPEKKWLTDNFGEVSVQKNTDGTVEATLEDVFAIAYVGYAFGNILNAAMRRRVWLAIPTSATAGTEEESYSALMEVLLDNAYINYGELNVYKPKEGQDRGVLKTGITYRTVHHNEDLHDHFDPRLIDFFNYSVDDLHPNYYPIVTKLDFDENHCHFLVR